MKIPKGIAKSVNIGVNSSCAGWVAGLMAIDSKSNAKRVITMYYPFCVLPLSVTLGLPFVGL